MKRIILAIVIALATLSSVNAMGKDFEPQYDSDTSYIKNYADWGEYENSVNYESWSEYEVWCYKNGIEPIYSEWEKSFVTDGHCDFDTMEKLGIDPEEEIRKLFENID